MAKIPALQKLTHIRAKAKPDNSVLGNLITHMYVYILMWGVVMSLGIVTAWCRPMKWATGDSIMGGKL